MHICLCLVAHVYVGSGIRPLSVFLIIDKFNLYMNDERLWGIQNTSFNLFHYIFIVIFYRSVYLSDNFITSDNLIIFFHFHLNPFDIVECIRNICLSIQIFSFLEITVEEKISKRENT